MAVSKKAWLGVARESTPGTAIATPTLLAPTKAGFKNAIKFVYLEEERGTRDGNNGRVQTTRMATGTFKGSWYNDSGPYFLLALMGQDTPSTPVAGVTSHAFALVDVPPTLTLFRALDTAAVYQLPYTVVQKMSFKWSAEGKLLEVDGGFTSRYSGPKMSSPPARPADTLILPFAGYVPTITVAGTQSTDMQDMTLDLEQKIEVWFNSAGSQDFAIIYFGERTAKIDFTARFDNDALYSHYTSGQDDHVNISFAGTLIVNNQQVAIPGSTTAGTFTLTYKGQTTSGIAWNATNATVATALQGLSTIGNNGCTVSGGPGPSTPWVVTFTGPLSQDSTDLLTGSGTGLTPSGSVTVTPATYPELLVFDFPIVGWDEAEHDTSKVNVLFKGKGTARPGTTINSLFTATVQNAIANYTV